MSSDFLAQLPGLTNPITHAGRVVYNAQRDAVETHKRKQGQKRGRERVYAETVMNDGDFTIQPYEICMRNKTSKYISGNPTDTDIHVFSSANGMLAERGASEGTVDDAVRKRRLESKEEEIAFAGIASNRAIYDPDNNANEVMLAVQVGGLQTLYNTGPQDINAGDIVMWRMPPLAEDDSGRAAKRPLVAGVNRSKLLFQTVSYKTAQRSLTEKVLAILTAEGENGAKAGDIVATLNEQKSRVMGKALSSASQGKTFDILLGLYCI